MLLQFAFPLERLFGIDISIDRKHIQVVICTFADGFPGGGICHGHFEAFVAVGADERAGGESEFHGIGLVHGHVGAGIADFDLGGVFTFGKGHACGKREHFRVGVACELIGGGSRLAKARHDDFEIVEVAVEIHLKGIVGGEVDAVRGLAGRIGVVVVAGGETCKEGEHKRGVFKKFHCCRLIR